MTEEIVHAPCPECGRNGENLYATDRPWADSSSWESWWVRCECGYAAAFPVDGADSPEEAWKEWDQRKGSAMEQVLEAMPVSTVTAKPLDLHEPVVPQALHRSVVMRVTDERDAARREAIALREALEKARALNAGRYKIIHEAAQHVDVAKLSEGLLPAAVEQAVRGREIALEKLMAVHRALEAAGDLIVRGPAGDTVAAKITALVAILRAALAERDELRALVAADTAKMLEMMGRRS
jgi:hypothetical protein